MSAGGEAPAPAGAGAGGWDRPTEREKHAASIPDPESTPVPAALRERIESAMALYPDTRSAAIPALHAAQELHGWCSPEAIEQVACVMQVTPAYLDSLATFYDMLETEPAGRHSVYVCTNISCSLRGADELLAAVEEAAAADPEVRVRAFECLGACDIAPMASVDGVYVGPLTPQDVPELLADLRAGRAIMPARQLARRLVADQRANSRAFPPPPPQGEGAPASARGDDGLAPEEGQP